MDGRDARLAKWFTTARRFPQLIGRTPDGTHLPGGPYTITQLVVAVVLVLLLWNTTGIWARFGFGGNLIVGPAILIGGVFAAGKLPFGMRSPAVVAAGWMHATSRTIAPPVPVRLRPPHRATHGSVLMITNDFPSEEMVSTEYEPAETIPTADPALMHSEPSAAPALTGVQQLLAARR